MSGTAKKPLPRPAPESARYWQAAREHRLELPRCNACGKFWFPPSQSCPHCLAADFAWMPVSGVGKIYSFVVFHRVYHPAFAQDVPYVVALVELAEGPRQPAIHAFVTAEMDRLEAVAAGLPKSPPDPEPLNELFRQTLREVW